MLLNDVIKVTELMNRTGGRFPLSAFQVSKATGVNYWTTKAVLNLQASRGLLTKKRVWLTFMYTVK
jgi:hypothetical protein